MKKLFRSDYHRKTTDNRVVVIYILLAYMMGMLTAGVFLAAYSFFKSINKQEPLLSPISGIESLTEVRKQDSWLEAMYQTIRWNESNNGTRGLAVTCTNRGKINETGFRAHQGFCFSSREEQEITVKQWLSKKITIEGMTKLQAMKLYTNSASYSYLFR